MRCADADRQVPCHSPETLLNVSRRNTVLRVWSFRARAGDDLGRCDDHVFRRPGARWMHLRRPARRSPALPTGRRPNQCRRRRAEAVLASRLEQRSPSGHSPARNAGRSRRPDRRRQRRTAELDVAFQRLLAKFDRASPASPAANSLVSAMSPCESRSPTTGLLPPRTRDVVAAQSRSGTRVARLRTRRCPRVLPRARREEATSTCGNAH